jgi:hypothetical protein
MYSIVYRGQKNPQPIKKVSTIESETGRFPLKFPCLSVHVVGNGDDHPQQYWSITWSHYYHTLDNKPNKSDDPGKFKLTRVWHAPAVVYLKEKNAHGKRYVDQLTMNKMAGRLKPERNTNVAWESETIEGAWALLREKFGDIGTEAMTLFFDHELFQDYYEVPLAVAA